MTVEEQDRLTEFLDQKLAEIGEHFEHVQILATGHDEGGTFTVSRGLGNWNARLGMAMRFVKDEDAAEAARYIASELNSDE